MKRNIKIEQVYLINKVPLEPHIPGYKSFESGIKSEKLLWRWDIGSKRHNTDRILEETASRRLKSLNSNNGEK